MLSSLPSQSARIWQRVVWFFTGTTPVSPVHPGKKDTHRYKFDPEIVRARRIHVGAEPISGKHGLMFGPRIDVSNLPAPDPRVQAIINAITVNDVELLLKQFSGEVDDTVAGATVRILTRNSFTKGLDTAMTKLEEIYKGLKVKSTRIGYRKSGRNLNNLEAVIPGPSGSKLVVIFGAHLDSTAGDTWRPESRAPGCDDDGTGTVALLLIAKAVLALQAAGITLPFAVRLVHFTGEEQGLWGSMVYSDRVSREGVTVRMINMDMIGYCNKPGNRVEIHDDTVKAAHDLLVVPLIRAVARYKLNLNAVDTHDHAVKDRHDAAPFEDHDMPAVCISEEYSEDGFNPNYHSVNDRIGALNLPYMVEVIRMLVAAVPELK